MEPTQNFLAIANIPFIGVKEYLPPDTQRDARNSQTGKLEAHNHCKSTSCIVAWHALAKILKEKYPVMESMERTDEFAYDAWLRNNLRPGEIIQSWQPHVRLFNESFQKNNIPLVATLAPFRGNESKFYLSMEKGFPVVLGTMITSAGHIVLLYRHYKYEGIPFHVIIDPYGNPLTNPKYQIKDADYYVIPPQEWDQWITPACNCIYFQVRGDLNV